MKQFLSTPFHSTPLMLVSIQYIHIVGDREISIMKISFMCFVRVFSYVLYQMKPLRY